MSVILGLLVTAALYAVFPLVYAFLQDESITKTRFTVYCFLLNISILLGFFIFAGVMRRDRPSIVPYVLWTSIFAGIGTSILRGKNLIEDPAAAAREKTEGRPTRYVFQCEKCGYQSTGWYKECAQCHAIDSFVKTKVAVETKYPEPVPSVKADTPVYDTPAARENQGRRPLFCENCGPRLPTGEIIFCPRCGRKVKK